MRAYLSSYISIYTKMCMYTTYICSCIRVRPRGGLRNGVRQGHVFEPKHLNLNTKPYSVLRAIVSLVPDAEVVIVRKTTRHMECGFGQRGSATAPVLHVNRVLNHQMYPIYPKPSFRHSFPKRKSCNPEALHNPQQPSGPKQAHFWFVAY